MNEIQTNTTDEAIRPTKKQRELLLYIEQFIAEHGYSPSYREIMAALNYTSVATVALHVGNLIKRGHLIKRGRSARSLEVVEPTLIEPSVLATNQVKAHDGKWLVEEVERRLGMAEADPLPEKMGLDELYILTGALGVLGLGGAVQSFTPRLKQLKNRLESRTEE